MDQSTSNEQIEEVLSSKGAKKDPIALFANWLKAAESSEINDPNTMALATADIDGMPNVRMVLLKNFDENGFVFYTNIESKKGTELAANRQAAGVFHWKSLRRQVRFRGAVEFVSDVEADAYFASRPRDSRIGAWASQQSRPMESRFALEKSVARNAIRFAVGEVPRPPHWTGYRIRPVYLEFWSNKPFRLHDRCVFKRKKPVDEWYEEYLYP